MNKQRLRGQKHIDYLIEEYVGKKIHSLTILDVIRNEKNVPTFVAKCDCSKNVTPRVSHVVGKGANTKSCGCYSTNLARKRAKNTPQNILPEGVSAFNSIYNQYKSGSKRRGYSFNLTKEEFKILIDRSCSYCGAPPSRERKTGGGSYFYNGIDRLDNSIGYEKGNCITSCTRCNFFKGTMNSEEFLELINIISKKNIVDNL